MSWEELSAPALGAGTSARAAVVVSCSAGIRRRRVLTVTIRPGLIENAPPFLAAGHLARAMLGHADHRGQVKLTAGGTFMVLKGNGTSGARGVVQLRLPMPAFVPEGAHASTPVEFDYNDIMLEFTLPPWAFPQAQPQPDATASQMRAPYRGTDVPARRAP